MVGSVTRVVLAVVVACSLAVAGWAAGAGASAPGAGAPAPGATTPHVSAAGDGYEAATGDGFDFAQVDADAVLLRVDLAADGDARWTVEYRLRLDDENATAAFDSLAEEIASNPDNFTERFGERMRETARAAGEATGREMAIRDLEVDAERRSLPQEYGIVVYIFEWTNFAAVDGEAIHAGDALGGLFLDEETRLVVRWPEGYDLQRATPEPDETRDRAAVWEGPVDFGPEEPRVVAAPPGEERTVPLAVGGVAVALLLVAATAVVVLRRRRGTGSSGTGDSSGGDSADAESAGADEPPPELLSNEERVLRLLEDNGGRMKQQEVVQELGWTDAKTSQVVGDLREEGKVEGFRLGRENVLRLPGEGEE